MTKRSILVVAQALFLLLLWPLAAFIFVGFGLIAFLPARLLALTDRTLREWARFCFCFEWLDEHV